MSWRFIKGMEMKDMLNKLNPHMSNGSKNPEK